MIKISHTTTTWIFLAANLLAIGDAAADSMTLPPGVPAPSFVNSFVLIDDPGNGDDSRTGYGGVNYKYRVSATQITVGDWVAFLNAVDPDNTMGFEPIDSSCGNDYCYSAYTYNGSATPPWQVTPFTDDGMNMTAAKAAKIPIDWLSLNRVARYMNWLATGNIEQGAFTFAQSGSPLGNRPITAFNAAYPGPRLPLEDELYKAMYWDKANQTYTDYPTSNLQGGEPVLATVNSSGIHNSNPGGALIPGYGGTGHYAQVGQEIGNPWGMFDTTGNRHETALSPSAPDTAILRRASAFGSVTDSRYDFRMELPAENRYVSIGYRVWMGVSAPSGTVRISKQVTGGSDPQAFSFKLDCAGTLYDKTGILLHKGETYESDAIPSGTQCTVTETTPTAPAGFTYDPAQYSPSQTVSIVSGQQKTITVTNPLQPIPPKVDIELNKTIDKSAAKRGDTVIYTLSATNKGPNNATNIAVTDNLPAGVSYVNDNGLAVYGSQVYNHTTGVWMIGNLANGETKALTITATIN